MGSSDFDKPTAKAWLQVQVRGKDPDRWANLRAKFIRRLDKLLDSTLDSARGTTVRDEAKEFTSALLDFASAKLAKPGLEGEKIAAEIGKTFAERQTELARADKTSEEARELRIKNDISELRLMLGATKAVLVGDDSDEAVLFGKAVDAFLSALNEMARAT